MRKLDKLPEVDFIDNKTIEDIRNEMLEDEREEFKRLTGKDRYLSDASPLKSVLNAAVIQIYQGFQFINFAAKMNLAKYSKGGYLDNLVVFKGLSRKEMNSATTILRFNIEKQLDFVLSIPKGTRVTNGKEQYFETDEYTEIKKGETFVDISAICTEKGVKGNGIGEGELNILINPLPYISSVKNIKETTGGREIESDDELADRFYEAVEIYTTTGTEGAYKYFAKEADQEVEDVIVNNTLPATVEITISKKGMGIPDEKLLKKVKEYLEVKDRKTLTDKIIVKAPEKLQYSVNLTYYISSDKKALVEKMKDDVEAAVRAFNMWQTEKIGRDINPSYLISRLMETGIKRVDITSPVYTVTPEKAIPVTADVNIVYGGLEDD